MFKLIKQVFISFLSFSGSLPIKCISLNNETCLARTVLIDFNSNKLYYFPFMVYLDNCDGTCDTLDDPSARICVLNKTEGVNLNVFNKINTLAKHISCDCKCKFDGRKCISNKRWNHNNC